MKKKLLLLTVLVMALICLMAISVSAESAYINAEGVQVSADSDDIAYELEFTSPWETGGNCRLAYIYLYDTTITKIIIPAVELTHSNGTVYKMAEYNYVRLSTGWGDTLSLYSNSDRDTKATSLHTQIKEIEFHIPILADGSKPKGNLAGWSGLEKLSFFAKAYEPQNKGGFLTDCTSLKELHFYGKNNELSGNFFCSTLTKIVFHEGATGTIRDCAMQNVNNATVETVVYMNDTMQPLTADDPRLTWNKSSSGLSFVYLVSKTIGVYDDDQIASYKMPWLAGNNKNSNNAAWTASIMTYCDFYEQHTYAEDDHNCETGDTCSKCMVQQEGKIHTVTIDWTYPNGYAQKGQKTITCNNEKGCLVGEEGVDKEGIYETPALVTASGYSTRENGKGGLSAGFTIDKTAIDAYSAYTKKDMSIGLIVANASQLTDKILDDFGELIASGVHLKNVDLKYATVEVTLDGFTVEQAQGLNLATMLYITEPDKVAYIQSTRNDNYSSKTVGGVEIEYATFEQVAKAKGFESITLSDGTLIIE